jgi:hypothetical protein
MLIKLIHFPTLFPFCLILLFSLIVGKLVCGSKSDGAAIGFLLITASSNLSVYLFSYLSLPLQGFIAGNLIILILLSIFTYFILLRKRSRDELFPNRKLFFGLAFFLGILVYLVNTIRVEPDSEQYYQAWYSLYIESSFQIGHFLQPGEMRLGQGFMTSGMAYAPNTLGMVAFLRAVGFEKLYPAYNACTIASKALLVTLLLSTVRLSRGALTLFSILFSTFVLLETNVIRVIGVNDFDEILVLSGAVVAFYLFQKISIEDVATRLKNAAFVSTFMVFGRNYGAYYSLILIVVYLVFCIRFSFLKLRQVIALLFILAVFSSRDVINVITHGDIFYPRSNLLNVYPPSLEKFVLGTLASWGIGYFNSGSFEFNINSIYLIGIGYLLILSLTHRQVSIKHFFVGISPLLLLGLPFSLEAIVQYRKFINYSKLYYVTVWFFFWYPAFLYLHTFHSSYNKVSTKTTKIRKFQIFQISEKVRFKIFRISYLFSIILVLLTCVGQGCYYFNSYKTAPAFQAVKMQFWERNHRKLKSQDELIVTELKQNLNRDELQKVVERKIIYFHYEPGIGLRYYLGGNIFEDLDYWSDPVQNILNTEDNFESFLCRIDSPNIYLSYGLTMHYQDFTSYPARPLVVNALKKFKSWPFLETYTQIGKGIFIQINPNKLECNSK